MFRYLCLLFLFARMNVLQAAPDINDLSSIEWAFADHPKSLENFARQTYRSSDKERNPRQWVRAVWLYGMLVNSWVNMEWQEAEKMPDVAAAAMKLAEANGYYEELIRLQFLNIDMYSDGQRSNDRKFFEKNLAIVDRYQLNNHLRIMVLGYYGFALRESGQAEEGLDVMQKAYKLLQEDPDASPLDHIFVRTNLALILRLQNKTDKAQELWLENEKVFAKHQLRSLHVTNLYNLGFYELKSRDPIVHARAEGHIRESMRLAKETGEDYTMASALLGLGSVMNEQKKYDEALKYSRQAAAIFKGLSAPVWEAESYKRAAAPLIKTGRFREALLELDKAFYLFPNDYELDQYQIADARYEALKGLGQFDKALEQLEKSTQIQKKLNDQKEDKNLADKMVQLGLQVEEEKNKSLQKDNERKSQSLREAERLRWALMGGLLLALFVIGLMIFAIWEAKKVKETRLRMQRILDNIEEGILTIDHNLFIEEGHSLYLQTLLQSSDTLQGKDLMESLFASSQLNADERHLVKQVLLACFGENSDVWAFNAHQLPVELNWNSLRQGLTLALHWQPIFNSHGLLQQCLLGIRDVTDRRLMQVAMQQERERSERLANKMSELASQEPSRVKDLLQRLEELSQQPVLGEGNPGQQQTLRSLHTAKGVSRSLKLRALSSAIHSCEDALVQRTSPKSAWNILEQELKEYQFIMQNIFKIGVTYQAQAHPALATRVMGLVPELSERLTQAGLEWGGLLIDDQVLPWPQDLLNDVSELLMHAMTNSIDHGFIIPRQKGLAPKLVRLNLKAESQEGELRLSVEDNGVGIDMVRLKKLALERGRSADSEQDILSLLFVDGISTAQATTESSGRGVGLAAVQSICESRHGTVTIQNRQDQQGTVLLVRIPLEIHGQHARPA